MSFTISGLNVDEFQPLFAQSDDELAERGIVRKTADMQPGYPCRVTLEDAKPGESVLLLNYESHKTQSPYRNSYAIFIREKAAETSSYIDEIPPVLKNRPIALRIFNDDGMLIAADLTMGKDLETKIEAAFVNPKAAYIHAHNAMHGCFVSEIKRGE